MAGAVAVQLSVHKALREEMMEHMPVLREWRRYAEEKISLAVEEKEGGNIFVDSHTVVTLILEDIQKSWLTDEDTYAENQCIVCTDTAGKVQAVALARFTEKKCVLNYLASNPFNFRAAQPLRGAGSAIIRYLAQRNTPISLDPLEGAIPFYEKVGFVLNPETGSMERSVGTEKRVEA